jgi:hypothetical protein
VVTLDDIALIVTNQLVNTNVFAAAVPGGNFYDRAPDTPTAYPYDSFTIATTPPDLAFGNVYIQKFQVAIGCYCPPSEMTEIDTATVESALWTALGTEAVSTALMTTPLRNLSERIMHSKPLPETGAFQPSLREGRDIFVCGLTVEIQVQGDRSVS